MKKKSLSYKLLKPRGCLVPPNKSHRSKKDYDRKREKRVCSYDNVYFEK